MADILEFDLAVSLKQVELKCGHIIFVTKGFDTARREDHAEFYCSACGARNWYPAPKASPPPPPVRKAVGEKIIGLFGSRPRR